MAAKTKKAKKAAPRKAGKKKRAARKKAASTKEAPAESFVILFDDEPVENKTGDRVVLDPVCTIAGVGELKETLGAVLAHEAPVQIDGSAVREVDTAALQLLCAFVRARAEKDRKVTWREPARMLSDAAAGLGLTARLGMGAE